MKELQTLYYTYYTSMKIAYVRTGGGVQANAYALRTGERGKKLTIFLRAHFMDGPLGLASG